MEGRGGGGWSTRQGKATHTKITAMVFGTNSVEYKPIKTISNKITRRKRLRDWDKKFIYFFNLNKHIINHTRHLQVEFSLFFMYTLCKKEPRNEKWPTLPPPHTVRKFFLQWAKKENQSTLNWFILT